METLEELAMCRLHLMKRHISMLEFQLNINWKDEAACCMSVVRLFSWIKLDILELFALNAMLQGDKEKTQAILFSSMTGNVREAIYLCFQDKELDEALDSFGDDKWSRETCSFLKKNCETFREILRIFQKSFFQEEKDEKM